MPGLQRSAKIMMPHGKSFLYGLAGTVQGRLGWADQEIREFCPQIDNFISEANWLDGQDFDTIHYVMRFGSKKIDDIYCTKRSRYQELEVASVESMESLHKLFLDRPVLRSFLATEVKRVMKHLQNKYQLAPLPLLFGHLDEQITKAEQGSAHQSTTAP